MASPESIIRPKWASVARVICGEAAQSADFLRKSADWAPRRRRTGESASPVARTSPPARSDERRLAPPLIAARKRQGDSTRYTDAVPLPELRILRGDAGEVHQRARVV